MTHRCLMIARFQPLHYGHLYVLKRCLEEHDELIVVIGMASQSHTPENPFTAGERILMVRGSLSWAGYDLSRVVTVTLPTMEVSRVAVHYVRLYAPPFEYVATLNPIISRIFTEEGYRVLEPPPLNRDEYRGSVIRKKMSMGDESWRRLVPPPVAELIDRIDGVERVRMLYKEKLPGYYHE